MRGPSWPARSAQGVHAHGADATARVIAASRALFGQGDQHDIEGGAYVNNHKVTAEDAVPTATISCTAVT